MLHNLTGWHALIVLAVIILVFGAAKLPALAKSIGQSLRILKTEVGSSDTTTGAGDTHATGEQQVAAEQPAAGTRRS